MNAATIGTQGGTGYPSSNHWNGGNFNLGQTYVSGSLPTQSILYCLNIPISKPTNNQGTPYFYQNIFSLIDVISGSEILCNYIPALTISNTSNMG